MGNNLPMKDLEVCLSQKDNLEAIFNSVSEGIITVNNKLDILNLNQAAAAYIGKTRKEAAGKPYTSIFKKKLGDIAPLLKEIIKKNEAVKNYTSLYQKTDGTQQKIVLNTAILQDKDKNKKGLVVVFKDITEITTLRRQLDRQQKFMDMVGKNQGMQGIYHLVNDVANSNASTLIYGESGTGKELIASAIHNKSKRSLQPFIKVNCSALSESLLESELFGHVKGAFTGAIQEKAGRFQLANKGTIFLDEIGDISAAIQVKLLRALQEGVIERVGDAKPVKIDVRIISATNKNLKNLIEENKFREDLYYRLKVIAITMPPLRERKDDIPLLINHFIEKFNIETGKQIKEVSDEVLELFMKYQWKGNVRELENAIEHSFVLCKQSTITKAHIPIEIKYMVDEHSHTISYKKITEKDEIMEALEKSGWNKSKAARLLGIDRTTLWRKMKEKKI